MENIKYNLGEFEALRRIDDKLSRAVKSLP
jgi:hypothetical protein